MPRVVTSPPEAPPFPDGAKPGGWWHESAEAGQVVCDVCPRACVLKLGKRGFCFVRENRDGQVVSTTYGRSTGFCVDPIEKKPLNQFYPGTAVLSFGTAGCNLGCQFCQNWTMSRSRDVDAACELADPETIATAARELGCRSVAFTYNDPIIWTEYAIDTARACHDQGVKTVAVTSGYIQPVAREAFYREMDAANVDLKAFTEEFYRDLTGGHLEPVLDTLRWLARETDTWVEITNLIIPRANDSLDEIEQMCRWIVEQMGPDVPVHFSAFHPDFKLMDRPATPVHTLIAAHEVARRVGLRYVYTGNVSDRAHQSTYCPGCGRVVIERDGYALGVYQVREGRCGHCGEPIAGRYDESPGQWGGRRMPVRIAAYARPKATTPDPHNPVSGEEKEVSIKLFEKPGNVRGTRRAISEIFKWMNYVTDNRFITIAADLAESINVENAALWGHYDPVKQPAEFDLDIERAHYWIQRGAKPSETVRSLMKRLKPDRLSDNTATMQSEKPLEEATLE